MAPPLVGCHDQLRLAENICRSGGVRCDRLDDDALVGAESVRLWGERGLFWSGGGFGGRQAVGGARLTARLCRMMCWCDEGLTALPLGEVVCR